MELSALIQLYIAAMRQKGQAGKTLEEKTNSLNRFARFVGNRPLTPQIALDYTIWLQTKEKNPYKGSSLGTEITHLKTFEKWTMQKGYGSGQWTILLERPQKEASLDDFVYVDPLLIDEAIVLGTTHTKFVRRGLPGDNALNVYRKAEARECLKFVSRKGLRIAEALRLTGSDLNFNTPHPEFRIAPIKKHAAVWVQIPADMIEELRSRKDRVRVFETTERLCNESLQRGWKKRGLPDCKVKNHLLRHQHAAHLLKNGLRLEQVQIEMRHKSIKVTMDTYGHLLNADVDPLVQAADPRSRRALDFEKQATYIEDLIKRQNLVGQVAIRRQSGELIITLTNKQ